MNAEDEAVCRTTVTKFFRCLDERDFDGALSLLHNDVRWIRPGRTANDLADIRSGLQSRPADVAVFHVLSGIVLDQHSEDEVHLTGYLQVYRAPIAQGDQPAQASAKLLHVWRGKLTRTDRRWLISFLDTGSPKVAL